MDYYILQTFIGMPFCMSTYKYNKLKQFFLQVRFTDSNMANYIHVHRKQNGRARSAIPTRISLRWFKFVRFGRRDCRIFVRLHQYSDVQSGNVHVVVQKVQKRHPERISDTAQMPQRRPDQQRRRHRRLHHGRLRQS